MLMLMPPRRFVACILALTSAAVVRALQPHPQPLATGTLPNHDAFDAANGWTPKPTSNPDHDALKLFKRQGKDSSPGLCGYVQREKEEAIICGASASCLRDPGLSWFGCCTGTALSDCGVRTTCVESRSMSACLAQSSGCADNSSVLKCTSSASPFCGLLFKTVSGTRYEHLECATVASSSVEVFLTSSSSSSSSRRSSSKVTIKSTSTKTTTRTSASGSTTRKSSSSYSGSRSGPSTSTTTRLPSTTRRLNSSSKADVSQTASVQQTLSEIVTFSSVGAGAPSATASAAMAPLEGVDAVLGVAGYVVLAFLAVLSW